MLYYICENDVGLNPVYIYIPETQVKEITWDRDPDLPPLLIPLDGEPAGISWYVRSEDPTLPESLGLRPWGVTSSFVEEQKRQKQLAEELYQQGEGC